MFNFGRKLRRVARRQKRRGLITKDDYQKIVTGSHNKATLATWQQAIEKGVPGAPWLNKAGRFTDFLSEVWDWLIENWPTILKIILSLIAVAGQNTKNSESVDDSSVGDK